MWAPHFLCSPARLPTLLRCSCHPPGAASLAHPPGGAGGGWGIAFAATGADLRH